MVTELQTLEGLDDVHRGAGYSCQLGNAEQSTRQEPGWSQLQQLHDEESDLDHRGPLPESRPYTTEHIIKDIATNGKHHTIGQQTRQFLLAEVLQRSGLPQGGEQRLVSSRPCTKSSSHGSSSLSSGTGSLLSLLDLCERRHLSRGVLHERALMMQTLGIRAAVGDAMVPVSDNTSNTDFASMDGTTTFGTTTHGMAGCRYSDWESWKESARQALSRCEQTPSSS